MAKKRGTGFAARLRELRIAAGLTQAQLADRAGMHLHGLTKLEQGDREPAWATVLDLARALGVGVGDFVVGAPAETHHEKGNRKNAGQGTPRGRPPAVAESEQKAKGGRDKKQ